MSIVPIITFKAGRCEIDTSTRPHKVKAMPEPGYIFLYSEDELTNFCWRPRDVPIDEAPIQLVMVPGDGRFEPYEEASAPAVAGHASAKTNGRIFVLKFTSSSQRYLFWLQSKPQAASGDPAWFSPRDRKIGELVDRLLQGEEPDVGQELAQVQNSTDDSGSGGGSGRRGGDADGDDDDETMEDAEGQGDAHDASHGGGAAGGAGAGATGGDVRREGSSARDGGADGARAASSSTPDAATVVRNLLASLSGQGGTSIPAAARGTSAAPEKLYPMLNELLETSVTIPVLRSASEVHINGLLDYLPPAVLILSQQEAAGDGDGDIDGTNDGDLVEPTADAVAAAKAAMTLADKKSLLEKVLRSPQFSQSLSSLSTALRDGGLPSVAEALAIPVRHRGYLPGGAMPMGGGEAVEAFVEGVKTAVQEKLARQQQ